MLVVVATVRQFLPQDDAAVVRVAILVMAGAATYGAVMILAFRTLVQEIVTIFYRDRHRAV
jgi:hypothetical protein